MPQLDFSTYPSQIFWLAVTFILLYILVSRLCLPTIREVLQNRQSRITGDLKKAENLKEQAKEAESDFTGKLGKAKTKATALITDARNKTAKEEHTRFQKLEATFSKQQKESEQNLKTLKKSFEDDLIPLLAESAVKIAKDIAGVSVTKKDAEKRILEISKQQQEKA